MSYTTITFLIFLPAAGLLYYIVPKRIQWTVLLAASLAFYILTCGKMTVFLLAATAVIYTAGLALGRLDRSFDSRKKELDRAAKKELKKKTDSKKRAVVLVSVILMVLMIFCTKYFNFFGDIINSITNAIAHSRPVPALQILMPLGISYYTLMGISYIVDVYRKTAKPEKNPLMLMLFALLTAVFTIGVELKNGTASEWLAASGGHTSAALAGKLAPYTVIFFVLCLLMDTLLFKYVGVPLNGSVSMLLVSGLFFVLASQGIGAFIVILLSNLRLGLSIGGGYSVLSFTFSGLTFPFLAMDLPVRIVGYLFPMTYYMDLFIDQGMRGAPTADSAIYLVGLAAFLLLPWTVILRLRKICTEEKYWGRL